VTDSIDTPSLDQRVAELEQRVLDLEITHKTLWAHMMDARERFGLNQRNCKKCGRQVIVPKGTPCPLCGQPQ
jgi:rubrerythrin